MYIIESLPRRKLDHQEGPAGRLIGCFATEFYFMWLPRLGYDGMYVWLVQLSAHIVKDQCPTEDFRLSAASKSTYICTSGQLQSTQILGECLFKGFYTVGEEN